MLVVLGYSRLLWLKFYPRQTLETVIVGLEEAFAYFGGVPHELSFDQMKSVIVDDRRAEGGKLLENPEFLRFARQMHWLNERPFLDAVAVSMITPGPVVITVAFIGYLVAGPLGACAAAAGVFLPVYTVVVLVARWFHRLAANRSLRAAIDGVTAAATGGIAGAVVVLGRRALTDVPTWCIFGATLGLVMLTKKIAEPVIILSAGVVGIVLQAVSI